MAAAEERDGRNFRQTYYEKVGFKGVEEKRSLEMILNEKPLDVNRLTQFTCRFNLPDVHRERVWLLLLGCPPTRESGLFIANEQRRLTDDLEDALHVMNLQTCGKRDQRRGHSLALMYLIEKGCLRPGDAEQQLQSPDVQPLVAIASNLTANAGIRFENDYWILKEFVKLLNRIDQNDVRNRIRAELAAEEPVLFHHLKETASLSVIPCDWWLTCCFAGLISQPFLIKVWDKLVAGNAHKVMSLAGKHLLKFRKEDLLSAADAKQIHKILHQTLPQNKSESLVKEVINHLSDV